LIFECFLVFEFYCVICLEFVIAVASASVATVCAAAAAFCDKVLEYLFLNAEFLSL